jgi:hypothetical protein
MTYELVDCRRYNPAKAIGRLETENGAGVGRLATIEGDLHASHATADRNDSAQEAVVVAVAIAC